MNYKRNMSLYITKARTDMGKFFSIFNLQPFLKFLGKTNYDEKLFLPIQRLPLDYSKKSTLLKNNNQEAGINLIKEKCSTTKLQLLDTQKEVSLVYYKVPFIHLRFLKL
jgi:hypothetical protein